MTKFLFVHILNMHQTEMYIICRIINRNEQFKAPPVTVIARTKTLLPTGGAVVPVLWHILYFSVLCVQRPCEMLIQKLSKLYNFGGRF